MKKPTLHLINDTNFDGPIATAIARLNDDPGAIFEESVLEQLRQIRTNNPPMWARIKAEIKKSGKVSIGDLEYNLGKNHQLPQGSAEIFPAVTPWQWPVNGADLLDEITTIMGKHIIADTCTIHAATLWTAFTWFTEAMNVAPIANITAPDMRCGKSVMLSVLAKLVHRPLTVSNIAPAALFRAMSLWSPTLLIDEVDSFLNENDAARGILNSGFNRDNAFVIRCTGDDHTPTRFNVWGAKALCGIGKIADTLSDRSITLRLRRKLPGEFTEKIRHADAATFSTLTSKLARFAADNLEAARLVRPTEIQRLNDRANDAWEPLLIVAELAGGAWPERARSAAAELHGIEEDETSIGAELLADIQAIFVGTQATKLFSANILEILVKDEAAPWATRNKGKAMTLRQMSMKLAEYGIRPHSIRQGRDTGKGYYREQFDDAFNRYLSPASDLTADTTSHPAQPMTQDVTDEEIG
jgi:hypothetical protein